MAYEPRISSRTLALLKWECANINAYLATFGPRARPRQAVLDQSGEFIRVLGFPLPDTYWPASADLVVIVSDFPAQPPYGLYMLNSDRAQVQKIKTLFGHFHVNGLSLTTPEAIPGYAWICYYYAGRQWRYLPDAPADGDNLAKFLRGLYTELAAGAR
jgi:hypothetical protein